jgi:hypothetical protein
MDHKQAIAVLFGNQIYCIGTLESTILCYGERKARTLNLTCVLFVRCWKIGSACLNAKFHPVYNDVILGLPSNRVARCLKR